MTEQKFKQLNHRNKIAGNYIPATFSFIILVFIDQFVKYLVDSHIPLYESVEILPDIFELRYIQNPGAAWGVLKDKQYLFIICTVIVLVIGVIFYHRCVKKNVFRDIRIYTIIILAGAVGNMIDRIRYQYVIDYFYFKLIDFPVFNIADCYVTVGFALLLISILFKYKEQDFDVLKN